MEILTSREGISLRELAPEDAEAYFSAVEASREHLAMFSDETNVKYPDLESVQASIVPSDKTKMRFGIWDDETFVGTINLRPQEDGQAEIGYWLDVRHTGKGYATLATSALAEYAHGRDDISRVYAEVVEDNGASIRVLERAGFVRTSGLMGKLVFDYLGLEN